MTVHKGAGAADPVRLTPEQAVSLVYELTLTAWSLSGRSLPQYTRATMPVRKVRSGAE